MTYMAHDMQIDKRTCMSGVSIMDYERLHQVPSAVDAIYPEERNRILQLQPKTDPSLDGTNGSEYTSTTSTRPGCKPHSHRMHYQTRHRL